MKLSIIITTRNRKADLLQCVDSIKQSELAFPWELIIVDDQSTDGTEKLTLEELRIKEGKIIHNSKQLMMVKTRNVGIKVAQGEYLLFIDDDNVIDKGMIKILVNFADNYSEYGIIGPSMYYLNPSEKYLDYQTINFFTGKTTGLIDDENRLYCDTDGVPNVFLIKKEVFEKCGYFDEELIQTFTEPDFAFHARRLGYKACLVKSAITYHNVSAQDNLAPRALGGMFRQKAYCLMRNRIIIISRYGRVYHKIIFLLFFSWFWPLAYSLLVLRHREFKLIKLYWLGFRDGMKYFFKGEISNHNLADLVK